MTTEQVLVEVVDDLATVTLQRPDRRNALSESMLRDLGAAMARAVEPPGVRAVILAATGSVFSSGHDFGDMLDRDLESMRRLLGVCTEVMLGISRLPVPVVARVQGIATAAGCQLVASCDLAVAVEEATFATPGGRGGWFCHTPLVAVARVIGTRRAMELGLTGDSIDARTALAWGLVNRVVPRDQLVAETQALARAASRGSLASKALGKRAFYRQIDLGIEAAYAEAMEVMAQSAITPDGREAMRAFVEKRPAVYPPVR
ncbi:MAG TPA: enoyl-CoA hydratase-related protein [Kofleriaceae bacterium]|jgi:enoyl-CoA hydratase/carnithine racemase|nr:enoyl-CoA hydratase-related protein [Kofleriaceae bacterium]